jgi:hypothetical protein
MGRLQDGRRITWASYSIRAARRIAGILGPMIAGAALTHWAVGQVYICFGLATCLLAFGFVLIPRSREFFVLNHDQVKDWFRHEYPDAFKAPTVSESGQIT